MFPPVLVCPALLRRASILFSLATMPSRFIQACMKYCRGGMQERSAPMTDTGSGGRSGGLRCETAGGFRSVRPSHGSVVGAIGSAQQVVDIVGAGASVDAGIPDGTPGRPATRSCRSADPAQRLRGEAKPGPSSTSSTRPRGFRRRRRRRRLQRNPQAAIRLADLRDPRPLSAPRRDQGVISLDHDERWSMHWRWNAAVSVPACRSPVGLSMRYRNAAGRRRAAERLPEG